MTTFPSHSHQGLITAVTYQQIDASINTLRMEEANAVLPGEEFPVDPMNRLLTIYTAVKPLLVAVAGTPLLPKSWRVGLTLFLSALQTVADGLGGRPQDFKAGKDL